MAAETLASMRAQIQRWLRGEKCEDAQINDAINDAGDALWQNLILAALHVYMAGPVTIPLAAGQEGVILISIPDPIAAPTVLEVPAADPARPVEIMDIGYTYVTESGSETMLSPITTHTLSSGGLLAAVQAPPISNGAIGWNGYVRTPAIIGNLVLQNAAPLPFLTTGTTFNEPETGWIADPNAKSPPTENQTGDNIFYIRHFEFKTSSGMFKSYNAGDLDSDFMRRMSQTIATTSEYQTYAWDLINQRQLEIRPPVGASFNPRYFYIVKPRRLAFDTSPMPFQQVPATEFLRDYALSELFLSLHEYEASAEWTTRADRSLLRAVRALTQTNSNRNERVTPYMH